MNSTLINDFGVWISLGIGLGVSGLVFSLGRRLAGRRRRRAAIREEELPWDDLLPLLRERYAGKSAAEEALSSDELLDLLLKDIPTTSGVFEEEANWTPGADRRRSRRRWANPVEVRIISPFHDKLVYGLVVNRSTGGMAILTDLNFAPDTVLSVRALGVPSGVGHVSICVRNVRKVGKLWIIGCQYSEEVHWDAKVWFG